MSGLENLLIQTAGMQASNEEKSRRVWLQLKSALRIPDNAAVEQILMGRNTLGSALHQSLFIVCDLSKLPYGSAEQRAAFMWLMGNLSPLTATVGNIRRVFVLEEIHLLGSLSWATILPLRPVRECQCFA